MKPLVGIGTGDCTSPFAHTYVSTHKGSHQHKSAGKDVTELRFLSSLGRYSVSVCMYVCACVSESPLVGFEVVLLLSLV